MKTKKIELTRPVTERFFKVVRLAIAERWEGVETKKDIAEVLDVYPQQLISMEVDEKRNVTIEIIILFCKKFKVSANYIILDELPIKREKMSAQTKIDKIRKILND